MADPVLVTPPDTNPVSLAEVKEHLRVSHDDEDAVIGLYLGAAVSHLDGPKGWLARALAPQTWAERFPRFAGRLRLAVAPILAVDSVAYLDQFGASQTVAADWFEADEGEVAFLDDFVVPSTLGGHYDLTVTYQAGYETVPSDIRAAILLLVGDLYTNREASIDSRVIGNPAVRMLLDPYRRGWMA